LTRKYLTFKDGRNERKAESWFLRMADYGLGLVNLGNQVRRLLGMTNLLSVFAVIGDRRIKMG
jgi:hypothetical protein